MTVTDKTKKRLTNIALIVMCVIILLGVALTIYCLTADKHIIKVSIEPDETKAIRFKELFLYPGESCEYTLSLSSEYAKKYQLALCFEDQNLELTLKNYAYIRMEKDGNVLCDTQLAEIFKRQTIELAVDFTDGETNDIKIIYYMPEDVGNEAQNAEADFKLLVTATNE